LGKQANWAAEIRPSRAELLRKKEGEEEGSNVARPAGSGDESE